MNEALTVHIRNPFALKAALGIVYEVTWPDLPPEYINALKVFTCAIPSQTEPVEVHLFEPAQVSLLRCAAHFRHTRACQWLREELRLALTELITPLQKGAADRG